MQSYNNALLSFAIFELCRNEIKLHVFSCDLSFFIQNYDSKMYCQLYSWSSCTFLKSTISVAV